MPHASRFNAVRVGLVIAAVIAAIITAPASTLQAQDIKIQSRERILTELMWTPPADRAVIGVTMSASSRVDTAGVRIEDVDTNGPAAKAGLKAGDIITDVNGVSVRVSVRVSATDAEDASLVGLAQRRLQRTMAKAKPGDEVELRVRSAGTSRSVRVKSVSADDLSHNDERRLLRYTTARNDEKRGVIGASVRAMGNARDTLGLFVSSVVNAGPADKAGVIEGDRIAAVNGVDVRVPREDFEDGSTSLARVSRLVREVQKVAVGGTVKLRVYSNGQYREVTVAVASAP